MRFFAIGDLHLSFAVPKPMDVFGPEWREHAYKLRTQWVRSVGPEDVVFVVGDISWALKLEQAVPDLTFLGELPGRKILIRGNHDYWWATRRKLRAVLPESVEVLQGDALALTALVGVTGTRGWALPGTPGFAGEEDERVLRRELGRLERGLAALAALGLPRRVCLLHYPPLYRDRLRTPFTDRLEGAGVTLCLYGHLHGPDRRLAFEGALRGVRYRLVSADHVDFAPVEVDP